MGTEMVWGTKTPIILNVLVTILQKYKANMAMLTIEDSLWSVQRCTSMFYYFVYFPIFFKLFKNLKLNFTHLVWDCNSTKQSLLSLRKYSTLIGVKFT